MASLNRACILGQLGADPEIRNFADTRIALLSVATNSVWTDKAGQRQESTQWHRIKVFGNLADLCETHLGKGDSVYVEGPIESRSYEDKQGNKRYVTEVKAKTVQFLGAGKSKADKPSRSYPSPPQSQSPTTPIADAKPWDAGGDEVPF